MSKVPLSQHKPENVVWETEIHPLVK